LRGPTHPASRVAEGDKAHPSFILERIRTKHLHIGNGDGLFLRASLEGIRGRLDRKRIVAARGANRVHGNSAVADHHKSPAVQSDECKKHAHRRGRQQASVQALAL